jgi:hypothetical protein
MTRNLESEIRQPEGFDGAGVDDAPRIGLSNNPIPTASNVSGVDATPRDQQDRSRNGTDPIAALIEHAATNLSAPPRYHASNAVPCRGDRLSRIIWQGEQWAVTSYGVECRDGTYSITRHRLWENEGHHGWIEHMAARVGLT